MPTVFEGKYQEVKQARTQASKQAAAGQQFAAGPRRSPVERPHGAEERGDAAHNVAAAEGVGGGQEVIALL